MTSASETPSVRDLLLDRLSQGSTPGNRTDGYRLVLAIEGGGMRGAVSSGMLLALEQMGLRDSVDEVVGTSAGAIAGAFFVTAKGTAGSVLYYTELNSDRFMQRRRLLKEGAALDLDYLLNEALPANGLIWDDVINSDIPLWATVTPAHENDDTRIYRVGESAAHARQVLAATSTLPVFAGPSRFVGNKPYVDGGITEAVPWQSAIDRGATHVLVIRSKGFNPNGEIDRVNIFERGAALRVVNRVHGPVVTEHVRRSNERFWMSTESLRCVTDGRGTAVASSGRQIVVDAVVPAADADLPDRLEVDTHVLMDALTAGAQAMIDYVDLEGFAVEQRVVITHPRAPVGTVRTNSLRPIVSNPRRAPR